jgi:hypothetical protein
MSHEAQRYTCPCCGYLSFGGPPGSYEICHVCYWEDDLVQLLDPWFAGGANSPSLFQAQENFEAYGAMEARFVENARGVLADDVSDPSWRRVVSTDCVFTKVPADLAETDLLHPEVLYYWRRSAT